MQFVTYNQALSWDRLERIFVISAAVFLVALFESFTSNPVWIFTSIATYAAQILVIKCWADMVIMSRPFENCWDFGR